MDRKEIRETIGVTALVLSLIFVGLEMRQNTRLLQAQTRDAITSKQLETVSWVATDQQNSRVFRVGWDSMETLTPDEEWQYATLVQGIMREWENSHYQAGLGLFTREEIEARQEAWWEAATKRRPRRMDRRQDRRLDARPQPHFPKAGSIPPGRLQEGRRKDAGRR